MDVRSEVNPMVHVHYVGAMQSVFVEHRFVAVWFWASVYRSLELVGLVHEFVFVLFSCCLQSSVTSPSQIQGIN